MYKALLLQTLNYISLDKFDIISEFKNEMLIENNDFRIIFYLDNKKININLYIKSKCGDYMISLFKYNTIADCINKIKKSTGVK